MRRSEERIAYFTGRFGEDLNEVTSHCLENPESCEVAYGAGRSMTSSNGCKDPGTRISTGIGTLSHSPATS